MTGPLLADFAPGGAWSVAFGETSLSLVLTKAEELRDSGRQGGSFRLEFQGPLEPVLLQATYRFERDSVGHEIFIVPIAGDSAGIRYEAIFA